MTRASRLKPSRATASDEIGHCLAKQTCPGYKPRATAMFKAKLIHNVCCIATFCAGIPLVFSLRRRRYLALVSNALTFFPLKGWAY